MFCLYSKTYLSLAVHSRESSNTVMSTVHTDGCIVLNERSNDVCGIVHTVRVRSSVRRDDALFRAFPPRSPRVSSYGCRHAHRGRGTYRIYIYVHVKTAYFRVFNFRRLGQVSADDETRRKRPSRLRGRSRTDRMQSKTKIVPCTREYKRNRLSIVIVAVGDRYERGCRGGVHGVAI